MMKRTTVGALAAMLVSTAAAWGFFQLQNQDDLRYPYHGQRFTRFVEASYRNLGSGKPDDFYVWMAEAYKNGPVKYPGQESLELEALLAWKKGELSKIADPGEKAKQEGEFCAWLHGMVKKTIPRFSLDRGFEFHYTVERGERQCFLQSVLLSGMLQSTGIDSGVVMVWKNMKGQESNNGHALALVKLPDGKDLELDCSEPEPFATHQGLFVDAEGYRFVEPVFDSEGAGITGYKAGAKSIATVEVKPLTTRFLDSQFDYYRGERAEGGIVAAQKTPEGLEASARYLKTSLEECPDNPLAEYMLGRVYQRQGKMTEAKQTLKDAYKLYQRFGWVPANAKDIPTLK